MLLSFAQFEREVTGERIRDKIAASKKKGIWVGGVVPLGYRVVDRKLVIDEAEAAIVRLVFECYLVLGSLPTLQRDLRDRAVVTRQRVLSSGRIAGGVALTNGPLDHMLRNRMYVGELNHQGQSFPGEHQAIVDRERFDAVQAKLSANLRQRRSTRSCSEALLQGRLYDDRGNRMSPTHALKKGLRYRYYVSTMLVQGRKQDAGSVPRVPAAELEGIVLGAIAQPTEPDPRPADQERIERSVERVVVGQGKVQVHLTEDHGAAADTNSPMIIAWSPQPMRRKREIIGPANDGTTRPIRAEARFRLLAGIARGRAWLDEIMSGTVRDIEAIATRESISERAARLTLSLAFVAPDIVEAAANGTLPRGFGLSRLTDLPLNWAEQRTRLGIPERA